MAEFSLVAPRTVEEATAALKSLPPGEAAVLAGGTDLLMDVDAGRLTPRRLVSLRHLPWRSILWSDRGLAIGATLPLRDAENDPRLRAELPGLYQAIRAVGSVALRTRATLGGNLARSAPASDLLPILLALDAELDLVGPTGARTVALDAFLRGPRSTDLRPAELIRSVRVPESRPSAYRWQRVRPVNDISQVAVAVARSPTDGRWRVAVGGVRPRPVRLPEVEEPLTGTAPPPEAVARAADRLAHHPVLVGDRRASDEYRRRLAGTLLTRAVAASSGRADGAA